MAAPTSPLPNLIADINSVANSWSNYATQLGAYLTNPGSSPLPVFSSFVTGLVADSSLTFSQGYKYGAVSLASGTPVSTVYKAAGMVREYNTRMMNKADYYIQAQGMLATSAADTIGEAGFQTAVVSSTTPYQTPGNTA